MYLESALEAYGRFVGKRPCSVAVVSFIVFLGLTFGWLRAVPDPQQLIHFDNPDLLWSNTDSHHKQELLWEKEYHSPSASDLNPWMETNHVTMFASKKEGDNILSSKYLEALEPLYADYFKISVTTKAGRKYNTWDLCARGPFPDLNPQSNTSAWCKAAPDSPMCLGSFVMPCKIASISGCFSEELKYMHPSFQHLEKNLKFAPICNEKLVNGCNDHPLAYSSRPSYKNMTDCQIAAEVSKQRPYPWAPPGTHGCPFWTANAVFPPTMVLGGLEWDAANVVKKATGSRWLLFYDGPRRTSYRMKLSKPSHTDEKEIQEAINLHQIAWTDRVFKFRSEQDLLDSANLGPYNEDDVLRAQNKIYWWNYIMGGACLVAFCHVVLPSFDRPMASRIHVGFLGLHTILFALASSGGIIALVKVRWNPCMIGALPLLGIGIGVNDMFVIIRYFSSLGLEFIDESDMPTIIGETTKRAGGGVTLTSLVNVVTFAIGSMLPIEAVSKFCIGASIVILVNYLVTMTIFLPCLCIETNRIKKRQAEPHPLTYLCHRRALKDPRINSQEDFYVTASTFKIKSTEKEFINWLQTKAGGSLAKPLVSALLTLVSIGLFVTSVWLISRKTIGYRPKELVEKGSPLYDALMMVFDYFTFFPMQVFMKDIDYPKEQQAMIGLFHELANIKYFIPGLTPIWLTFFYQWIDAVAKAPAPPSMASAPGQTFEQAGYKLDKSVCFHPAWAPNGCAPSDPEKFWTLFNMWNQGFPYECTDPAMTSKCSSIVGMPPPGDCAMCKGGPLSTYTTKPLPDGTPVGMHYFPPDMVFANEFAYYDTNATSKFGFSLRKIKLAKTQMFQLDLATDKDFLASISAFRHAVEASPLKNRVWAESIPFTYWSVFLGIDTILFGVIGACIGAVLIITCALLLSPVVALSSAVACGMIVIEIWGISTLFLYDNVYSAGNVLLTCGITFEFTAHLAYAFASASGTTSQRLGSAMGHVLPPLLEGSVSTFAAVLPLGFSPLGFILKYYFGFLSLMVFVGVLNGALFFPAQIAFLSNIKAIFVKEHPVEQPEESGHCKIPATAASEAMTEEYHI